MDSMKAFEIIPGPSAIVCTPNLTDEDSTRKPLADEFVPQAAETVFQAGEVSNEITINNLKISKRKNSKLPAKVEKPPLKRKKSTKEELPEKRKKTDSLPVSQMVMESIKALRKRNGASVQTILEHMENQYKINAKLVKRYVTRYLRSAVQNGIVEQLSGSGNDEKFKIRKAEKITKEGNNLKANQKMVKAEKITKEGKKLKANQKMVKAEKYAKIGQKLNDNEKKIKAKQVAKVERSQNQKKVKGEKVAKVPQ